MIAILAVAAYVTFNGVQARAKQAKQASDITAIVKAAELYRADNDVYPYYANTAFFTSLTEKGVRDPNDNTATANRLGGATSSFCGSEPNYSVTNSCRGYWFVRINPGSYWGSNPSSGSGCGLQTKATSPYAVAYIAWYDAPSNIIKFKALPSAEYATITSSGTSAIFPNQQCVFS